jgi:hypothetical protein
VSLQRESLRGYLEISEKNKKIKKKKGKREKKGK